MHLFLLMRMGLGENDYAQHIEVEHRELADVLESRDTERALRAFAAHRSHAFDLLKAADATE